MESQDATPFGQPSSVSNSAVFSNTSSDIGSTSLHFARNAISPHMLSSDLIGAKWEKIWDGLLQSAKDENQAGAEDYSVPGIEMRRYILNNIF